jgi:hypothetical protein
MFVSCFGFDSDNIARLELNKCCAGKSCIYATRYGIEDGDFLHRTAALG